MVESVSQVEAKVSVGGDRAACFVFYNGMGEFRLFGRISSRKVTLQPMGGSGDELMRIGSVKLRKLKFKGIVSDYCQGFSVSRCEALPKGAFDDDKWSIGCSLSQVEVNEVVATFSLRNIKGRVIPYRILKLPLRLVSVGKADEREVVRCVARFGFKVKTKGAVEVKMAQHQLMGSRGQPAGRSTEISNGKKPVSQAKGAGEVKMAQHQPVGSGGEPVGEDTDTFNEERSSQVKLEVLKCWQLFSSAIGKNYFNNVCC